MKVPGFIKPLFLIVFTLSVLLPMGFVFFAIEEQPAVISTQTPDSDDALRTRRFIKKLLGDLLNQSDQALLISATEEDLRGLFAFGHRSISRLKGRADISPERFELVATVSIPQNPIGSYLNFTLALPPSKSGFVIGQANIGRISFPDSVVRFLLDMMLKLAIGSDDGDRLLSAIDSVTLSDKKIAIQLKAIPNLKQLVEKTRTRLRLVRDEVAMMGDPAKIRPYYTKIMALSESAPTDNTVSLSYYIGPLFTLAQTRGGDPVIENRAAILSLGIYFGSWRVEQMIGPVRTDRMKRHKRKTKGVGLANRKDLRLHFIISSALQIAADHGITNVIGEFKELLDAGKGGSGFSFVDLAADRAGVRFALSATNDTSALRFQTHLANNAKEDLFFPDINGLPEGLSQEVFERYFVNLESERYRALVASVDTCIHQLPIYSADEVGTGSGACEVEYVVPEELLGKRSNRGPVLSDPRLLH